MKSNIHSFIIAYSTEVINNNNKASKDTAWLRNEQTGQKPDPTD